MDIDRISLIAQDISFAFEDVFYEKDKGDLFVSIFDKYLLDMDPGITMGPYDAIVELGRSDPLAFEYMLKELRDNKLID